MDKITVLLIEDDQADIELFRECLLNNRRAEIDIIYANCISSAIDLLDNRSIDLVLTDLNLSDSQGIGTLTRIIEDKPEIPVVVLSGLDNENIAIEAVKSGAQDYLIKGQIDSDRLMRSIHYSIERHRLIQRIKAISISDELTGLYNRRGFLVLAKKQLEMAARFNKLLWLIYLDIDNMKLINDQLGHKEGDRALIDLSTILKGTFRESDIIARIGGDEFAVIAVNEIEPDSQGMVTRMRENTNVFNATKNRSYSISFSVGMVACDTVPNCDIDELLSIADKCMYKEKIEKKN
jgi:two-component system, cell cycle response regulator